MKRQFGPRMGVAVKIYSVASAIYCGLYVFDILPRLGFMILPVAHNALFAGLFVGLTLLLFGTGRSRPNHVPWYDWFLILCALVPGIYLFVGYRGRVLGGMMASPIEIVFGISIMVATLEAIRRMIGWTLVIIIGLFLLYVPFTDYFPGVLHGPSSSLPRALGFLYVFEGGMFGVILQVAGTIVVAYMFFSQMLFATGVGQSFTDIALVLFGPFRGGPAKGAVVASGLFGTISGSAVGNVATIGILTIPLMKSIGYKSEFAGAVEAVASTGGALMPPVMGAVAFIMADFISVPYSAICIAAAWPAILYYLGVFTQVDLEAAKTGLGGLPREQLPPLKTTSLRGWYFFLSFAVLIVLLLVLKYSATTACLYTIIVVFVVSLFRKETRMGPSKLVQVFDQTSRSLTSIVPVCTGAGLIVGTLGLTGLGVRMTQLLTVASGGNIYALVAVAAVAVFILGMGVAWTATYILVAVLIAPSLIAAGLDVLAVHLFVFYFSLTAFITPPVAVAAYVAAGIADSNPMKTGWIACKLGIVAYLVPFVLLINPLLMLRGPVPLVVGAVIASGVGVLGLGAGVEGWLFVRTNWLQRILLITGGGCLLIPDWRVVVLGMVMVLAMALWQWKSNLKRAGSRL